MSPNRSIRNLRKKFSEAEMTIIQDVVTTLSMKRRPDSEIAKEIYKQINKSVTRRDISYVRERIIKENEEEIRSNWEGMSKSDKDRLSQMIMCYQRISKVSPDYKPILPIPSKGYDSAFTVGKGHDSAIWGFRGKVKDSHDRYVIEIPKSEFARARQLEGQTREVIVEL